MVLLPTWNISVVGTGTATTSFRLSNASSDSMTLSQNGDLATAGKITANGGAVYSETTQGAAKGTIHLDPDSATDNAGTALTFGASDSGSGNSAHAGIYTRSDGNYGTKMYLSTTDSYAAGSKTAIKIDHSGHVGIMRGSLLMGTNTVIDASRNIVAPKYYLGSSSSVYGVGIVNASSARFDTVDSGYKHRPIRIGLSQRYWRSYWW